jgi:hypothetical protein
VPAPVPPLVRADFPVDSPWGRHANGVHRYQLVRVFTMGG